MGWAYGTVGIIGLTIGGILGGIAASRGGLKKWLWPMVCAITLPDLVYVYLSYVQPASLLTVNICVFIEQFGYGFGFTAYMLYLIYFSEGEHKTSHYAICTGFMALGNRMILRQAMLRHGFKPLDTEWWHFTLKDEPFPDTYFTFPVK